MRCAFCDPDVVLRQTFYETEHMRVMIDHRPISEGHSLIMPKEHVERFEDLSKEKRAEVFCLIDKVHKAAEILYGPSDYLILQKNGRGAGQTVPHVHFHYVRHNPSEWWGEIAWFLRFFIPWMCPMLSKEAQAAQVTSLTESCASRKGVN